MTILWFFAMLLADSSQVKTSALLNEMADEQKDCGTDGIYYVQFSDKLRDVYVLIVNDVYSRRQKAEIAAAIACSTKIVVDRGYKPIILGTKK